MVYSKICFEARQGSCLEDKEDRNVSPGHNSNEQADTDTMLSPTAAHTLANCSGSAVVDKQTRWAEIMLI
jgi:hypothetical protein